MTSYAFGFSAFSRRVWHRRYFAQRRVSSGVYFQTITFSSRSQHSSPSVHRESVDLFHNTLGRWIYNEALRESERFVRFNVQELMRLAAECINQRSEDVVQFRKLAEGGFNRVFQISMRDGSRLVARIPYPKTEPKCLSVASEVATMDFLRSYDIPIPKVCGYLATSDNAAGVEYIIMGMSQGRQIGDYWYSMTKDERLKMISQIARIEGRFFSIPLPASGSIYYSHDLDSSIPRVRLPDSTGSSRFCVGPATDQKLWYRERSLLSVNRGPFTTPEDAIKAGAIKEIAYLKKYGRDRHIQNRLDREVVDYQKQSPVPHLRHLEEFLLIASHLCPSQDSFLSQPVIRHPDLNPNNIFLSDSFDVVGLIDWQHCSIWPLFLHSAIPAYFQNYGDSESESLVYPKLPQNFNDLDEQQQEAATEVYQRHQLHFYYLVATVQQNNIHYGALRKDWGMLKQRLFDHASSPWEGDNLTLKADLIEATQVWPRIVVPTADGAVPPCPISYSEEEAAEGLRLHRKMNETNAQEQNLKEVIGAGHEGYVPSERFEQSKALNAKTKALALEYAESDLERQMLDRHWPFDEQDEEE